MFFVIYTKIKMYHNYDNSQEVTKVPKPIGCIITLVGLWILFLVAWYFLSIWIMIYKDTPIRGRLAFRLVVLIIIWVTVVTIKRDIHLQNLIESWSAIRKKAKIIDFQFAENGGGWEDDTSKWYYVVVFDWENDYDGMFHRWARIIWKLEEEIKKDKFYEESGITLDLINRDITKKQLDARIEELKLKQKEASFFEKWKIRIKIWELENKKNDLEPYHLHTREWDFYIWDEYTILIDPEDPSNYTFERDNV